MGDELTSEGEGKQDKRKTFFHSFYLDFHQKKQPTLPTFRSVGNSKGSDPESPSWECTSACLWLVPDAVKWATKRNHLPG